MADCLRNEPGIKYLYARYRRVLSEDPAFRTWSRRWVTYYTLDPSVPENNNFVCHSQVNYSEMDFPPDVSVSNIHKKENLLKIARFFWEKVSEVEKKQQIWTTILDLVRYTTSFIPVEKQFLSLQTGGKVDEDDKGDISFEMHENDLSIEDSIYGKELEFIKALDVEKTMYDIRKLAEQCAARLSEREKKVIAILLDAELKGDKVSLKDVAGKVGFSGASGVSEARKRAYEKIKEFCCPFPGLSPYDYDMDVWIIFIKNLVEFCKV